MSVDLPDSALKTREEGNGKMCNGKESPQASLPSVYSGSTKYRAIKNIEDKLIPYRKSGDFKVKLPPINEKPKTYDVSTNLSIRDLKRQNGDLQLQLIVFKTQSKVMKNVLHRHTVAVKEYQRLEGNICEIQEQHLNEVKVLRKLIGKTRTSCDMVVRKLQAAEKELLESKDKILQLESQIFHNSTMLEREELSQRLEEATQDLKEKNKRIWDLERSNKLLQSTLHRHIAAEQRKLSKTNDVFYCLQTRVYELTKEIQERKEELANHNLPALRFQQLLKKKETCNKMVQTDEIFYTPIEDDFSIMSDSFKTDDELQKWLSSTSTDNVQRGSLAVKYLKKNMPRKERFTDFEKIPSHKMAGDCSERNEVTDALHESGREDQGEDRTLKQKYPGTCKFAYNNVTMPLQQKETKLAKIRSKYVFTPVITNLHLGRPAHSGLDQMSLDSQSHRQEPSWKSIIFEEDDTSLFDSQITQPYLGTFPSMRIDSFESTVSSHSLS
ncbi:lebercilin-like protein [Corythoichthys intestinalis]|uniref:lebercilin-like protein n=1 Tax=Corythoichthys intestinalis TaxID=161448 RepID=UPI0025A636A7|nr:lebercilin-like protein [Corythoichthys intestinalis]